MIPLTEFNRASLAAADRYFGSLPFAYLFLRSSYLICQRFRVTLAEQLQRERAEGERGAEREHVTLRCIKMSSKNLALPRRGLSIRGY